MSADFRKDLVARMENRALICMETYDVLAEELGAEGCRFLSIRRG